jgi:aerobic carbon-monoxide dehydrogenase large subunit
VLSVDFPSPLNELGIKGVGESGIIAPGAAVANAVEDALADLGVEVDALPVTGPRLFEWLRAAAGRPTLKEPLAPTPPSPPVGGGGGLGG